jgi:hypothetical protein
MEFDPTTGTLVSSGLVAGKDDPKTVASKTSGMMLTTNEHMKLPINNEESIMISGTEDINGVGSNGQQSAQVWVGTKKNLMIPMKFANHVDRKVPTCHQMENTIELLSFRLMDILRLGEGEILWRRWRRCKGFVFYYNCNRHF